LQNVVVEPQGWEAISFDGPDADVGDSYCKHVVSYGGGATPMITSGQYGSNFEMNGPTGFIVEDSQFYESQDSILNLQNVGGSDSNNAYYRCLFTQKQNPGGNNCTRDTGEHVMWANEMPYAYFEDCIFEMSAVGSYNCYMDGSSNNDFVNCSRIGEDTMFYETGGSTNNSWT